MRRYQYKMVIISVLIMFTLFISALAASAKDVDVTKLDVRFNYRNGSMYFLKRGWVQNEQYSIVFFNKHWNWQSTDGKWHVLSTPFIAKWNKYNHLILNTGGRIFVSRKDNSGNFEIRLINGEWFCNAPDEWMSLEEFESEP